MNGKDADCLRVEAGECLTVAQAAEFQEQLLRALGAAPRVCLSLGAVQEIDTAGLQLICAAARSAREREVVFSLSDTSGPVREAIRLCGLACSLEELIPAMPSVGCQGGADG